MTLELARKCRDQGDLIDELVEALERINRQAGASIEILFRDASTAEARREKARELHSGLKDIGDSARALIEKAKERR
jgi:hypothetical protein